MRIAKLIKLTDPNSALADAMEDLFLTSHWAAATRVLFLLVLAFFCAHLLACSRVEIKFQGPAPSTRHCPHTGVLDGRDGRRLVRFVPER